MSDNQTLIAVAEAAALKGWHIIGFHKERHRDGFVPGGHVAIVRDQAPFEDRRCATLAWGLSEIGVQFMSGNYDMTRDEAVTDLEERKR